MESEPHEQREHEPQITPNPFDLSVLSDEQIDLLNHALTDYYEATHDEDSVEVLFNAALVALAEQDPDRGRQLLQRLAASDKWQSRETAAYFAGSFGTIDADFAAQILIDIKKGDTQRDESEPGGVPEAVIFGSDNLSKHMTPEQAENFRRRMDSLWREPEGAQ